MKRILYCLPVDWDWIKQRPQFLAQHLAEKYEVFAIYCWQYRRRNLQNNASGKVKLCPIKVIPPLGNRFSIINKLNQIICQIRFRKMIQKYNPEYCWITFPMQVHWIPKEYRGKIIYDCMDDYAQLWPIEAQKQQIAYAEIQLCQRADVIFCSSQKLKENLCQEVGNVKQKLHLLRNGCEGELYPKCETKRLDRFRVGYVGTIADWFDFSAIKASLDQIPNLEYELIGPVKVKNILMHERVHYHGVVEHAKLYERVQHLDCMVMPFQRNSIVDAVDPVKLYEYISWQKPIVAVKYGETERFYPFVQLYQTEKEYCTLLLQISKEKEIFGYLPDAADSFLKQNSWNARAEEAIEYLK